VAAAALAIKSLVVNQTIRVPGLGCMKYLFISNWAGPAFVPSDLNGQFFNFSS
jgi:hypothetical protein